MSLLEDSSQGPPLPLRVLVYDIETGPLNSHHWNVWNENIHPDQLHNRPWMICWSAKWSDRKRVVSDVVTPDEAKTENDGRVVESLAKLVRAADVTVAHNLKGFDYKVLNTRLLDLRLDPLPPVTMIDTLQLVKRDLKLTYNRLDYLAEFLGLEPKLKMKFGDWLAATKGDDKALRKMDRYCRHDTALLEDVLTIIRPYVKGLPRMVDAVREMQHACPHCGHGDVAPTKDYRTKASNFAMYQCKRCRGFMRVRSAKRGTKLKFHPL